MHNNCIYQLLKALINQSPLLGIRISVLIIMKKFMQFFLKPILY